MQQDDEIQTAELEELRQGIRVGLKGLKAGMTIPLAEVREHLRQRRKK